MTIIVDIIIGLLIGGFVGYVLAKLKNHDENIERIEGLHIDDWYDLLQKNANNSNRIEYIEEFLKMKFPDMDKIMIERYAHLLDEQETKE